MDFHLDRLLGFPYVTVESCHEIEDNIYLNLRLLNEGINCPRCQKYVDEIHQNRPILVKDLPIFGKPVYLKVPRRQFECKRCKENDRSIRIFISIPPTYKTLQVYLPSSSGDKYRASVSWRASKIWWSKGIFDYVSKQHQKTGNQ